MLPGKFGRIDDLVVFEIKKADYCDIRNGQTVTMKKGGAGHANWGVEGDEVPDLYEYTHQEAEEATAKADKVKLVDADTFKSMRS